MTEQKIVYSFAWFQPEEWTRLKEVVEDPSTLDDTYDEWRKNAESTIGEFRANGQSVRKISIKINELLDWCESKGVKPDGKARSEFAALKASHRGN